MDFKTFQYKYLHVKSSAKPTEESILVKQTLLNPPHFLQIIPQFNVLLNKPFRGLNSTSLNDVDYQDLLPQEADSQLEAFSESEDDMDISAISPSSTLGPTTQSTQPTLPVTEKSVGTSIKIIVKSKSLLINNIDLSVGAEIRSSTVLKGVATLDSTVEEDTLLISLKSGFLLLIRIFYVPRHFRDSDYHLQSEQQVHHEGNSIFKPFIMQWWDTSSHLAIPSLESLGHTLHAHSSGLTVVSTSASGMFRLYNTQFTRSGVLLKKHFNVEVDKLILNSCFAEPARTEHHVMFLTLTFTEFKRLSLSLFQWSTLEGLGFSKLTLPLDNSFQVPIFIVSLAENALFLFVGPKELVIVTVNNIVSADYSFRTIPAPWNDRAFPTTSYRLLERIEGGDEVFISTDIGVIYSVVITPNSHIILPVLRVAEPISVFSLERTTLDEYNLIYGSDTGGNKDLLLELLTEEESRCVDDPNLMNYTPARLVKDYKKWAPLLDVQIIPKLQTRITPTSSTPEIYGISGTGRKTKLTNIKTGYSAKRKSASYERLRKAERIFNTVFDGRTFVFCSMAFETLVLEYQPESQEVFVEIEDILFASEPSLHVSTLSHADGDFIFQVTSIGMLITNLSDIQMNFKASILLCSLESSTLAVVTENMTLEVFSISSNFNTLVGFELSGFMLKLSGTDLVFQPSVVKVLLYESGIHIAIGDFEGNIHLYTADSILVATFNLTLLMPSLIESNLLIAESVIPHDIVQIDQEIFIGTKDGYYIHLSSTFEVKVFLRLSEVPVHLALEDRKLLFVHCRQLYLCNFHTSLLPQRVHFDEVYERSVLAMTRLPNIEDSTSGLDSARLGDARYNYAFIRDDGLMAGSIFTFTEPTIRQITVADNAKKLLFLPQNGLFAILCKSKQQRNRIRFVDRRLFKLIQHNEQGRSEKSGDIFSKNEFPTCIAIWSVERNGRVLKKLLVGSTLDEKGTFKVLDVVKSSEDPLRLIELTSFEHLSPITHIVQVSDDILFTSGKTIYVTTYNADEKRLRPVQPLFRLVSEITHLSLEGETKLLVTTKKDSIFQFEYSTGGLSCIASDPLPNSFVNQARLGEKYVAGDKLHSSISIIEQPSFSNRISYQMSIIPRIYIWSEDTVLCVGVNGEIVAIRSVLREELSRLTSNMGVSYQDHIEILERPFDNRVSGMGLLSLNKPSFDFRSNRGILVDFDLDDLAQASEIVISL